MMSYENFVSRVCTAMNAYFALTREAASVTVYPTDQRTENSHYDLVICSGNPPRISRMNLDPEYSRLQSGYSYGKLLLDILDRIRTLGSEPMQGSVPFESANRAGRLPAEEHEEYRKILEEFIADYYSWCSRFLSDYSREDIFTAGLKKQMESIDALKERIDGSRLDGRVVCFTDLYRQYINAAIQREDEGLLLENLFAVPERMYVEFTQFGFLK